MNFNEIFAYNLSICQKIRKNQESLAGYESKCAQQRTKTLVNLSQL